MSTPSVDERISISSFPYASLTAQTHTAEFIGTDSYIPLILPTLENTQLTSVLPIEGESVDFTVVDKRIVCDSAYHGSLIRIVQNGTRLNGAAVQSAIGRMSAHNRSITSTIIDGGFVYLTYDKDIVATSGGLVYINGVIYSFSGIQLSLNERLVGNDPGSGFSLSIFLKSSDLSLTDGILVPYVEETDLVKDLLGDYRTLYSVIQDRHSYTYSDPELIEICRMQVLSQIPSTPYIAIRANRQKRNPPVECYLG